jgi:pyruvate carboxylase subunit B
MRYFVSVGGREVVVVLDGQHAIVDGTRVATPHLTALPGTPIRHLTAEGVSEVLAIEAVGRGLWAVGLQGERHELEVVDERTRHIRSLTGGGQRAAGPAVLKAPMPGMVMKVSVEAGQQVEAGTALVVLEAMKMENELRAPTAGVVKGVKVKPGEAVEKGQVLVEFELGA